MNVKRYTLRSIYKALSSGQDLEMPDCDVIAETDYDALDAQFAELRQHLGTLTPGGSHTCITCAAHVKVITEDLEPRIRALEADLAAEKMQHSVTIADEHESRTAFQDGIRAIEAELIGEMKLRQTAEAYAARNALRVIALQDALRKIVRDGDYTAHEGMKRIANEALATEPETLVDLKDPHNAHHPDRLKGPGLTAKETKGDAGG